MKPYLRNKNSTKKRAIIIVAALLVLAIIGFGTSQVFMNNPSQPATDELSDNTPEETINYAPATEEEKQRTEQHKEELAKQQSQPSTPTGSQKTVTPVITDAGQYGDQIEVRSFVPNIVESGGKCTYTFKQNMSQLQKTSSAIADATTTRCEPTFISHSEFPASGKWILTVTYTATTSSGTSDPWEIEVK